MFIQQYQPIRCFLVSIQNVLQLIYVFSDPTDRMTLSVEDCMCPICMCIMVEPVTMPCKHTLCYPCFKQNVEEASLACPMCRVRISVWARRSSKNGTLVNKKLWTQIQQLFPEKVEKRQKGLDDSIEEPGKNLRSQPVRLKFGFQHLSGLDDFMIE